MRKRDAAAAPDSESAFEQSDMDEDRGLGSKLYKLVEKSGLYHGAKK